MVIINIAYTAPVNPAGAEPALSQAQIWAGLERKVRRAQDFVPIIVSCNVLSEEQTKNGRAVTREVQFKGAGPKGNGSPVTEICTLHAPSRIDFEQDNGSFISNIVSKGPAGEFLMTYSFEWLHPNVADGSDGVEKLEAEHWATAKMAVQGSIDTIRRLVKEGVIN